MDEKILFKHVIAELNLIRQAFYRDSVDVYVMQNSGSDINLRWPQSKKIVISPLKDMPFQTLSETDMQELCCDLLCCSERMQVLGFLSSRKDVDAPNRKTIFFIGEEERYYALDYEKENLYLLAESTERFAFFGLHRFDPIYEDKEVKFLTPIDNVLQSLINTQNNLWSFAEIIEANSGRVYNLRLTREKMDEKLVFFLTRKEELPSRTEWTFLTEVYDSMPYYGHIIGSVGKNLMYPKSLFLMMDLNGVIYGIDAIGTGIGPCVKIAENFESFLKQGVVRAYRTYKFFPRNLSATHEIFPLCPHATGLPTYLNEDFSAVEISDED
ncbi:U17 protein [macacine betaherpesvirus 9]|uniref:U17 protein n=1 Tax=macacine betaherpesvirus 9 TaxID=2560568 RepID=A0A191S3U4_9BETA|nr:U17 protein [macacine betaherpesvirus 9]ANC96560.1 U17 protein [macacine betaherpesvirus 9]